MDEHIDVAEQIWVKSIQDELRRNDSCINNILRHTIFRVPWQLREVNRFAYDPLVLAVGPYKKSRKLEPSVTESFMRISAANVLLRAQNLGPEDFQGYASRVTGNLKQLIVQYESIPKYSEDALTAMFALDASFVTCFLLYLGCSTEGERTEFAKRVLRDLTIPHRLMSSILRDLFLLENQIPLALLRSVVVTSSPPAENVDAEEELMSCIDTIISGLNPLKQDIRPAGGVSPRYVQPSHAHLLDSFYAAITTGPIIRGGPAGADINSRRSDGKSSAARRGPDKWAINVEEPQMGLSSAVESAVHLRRAGISFKTSTGGTVRSISFDERTSTLYLPNIIISTESESLLRNLAAYEILALQRAELGCYLAMMDDLIDTEEDVQTLRMSGVLVHSLRNDSEVADLWNSMCKNLQVLYETQELKQVHTGIKDHLRRRMRFKMAWELYADFSERYLSAPWLTASVLAATLLLILTGIQTVFAVALYKKE